MPYAVKEIFYTLQGEGAQAGRPAVFLRFAGCNLWSGRIQDREKGPGDCSRWCDTDFVGTDGPSGGQFPDPESLARTVRSMWPQSNGKGFVVCTGGEPLLQLDSRLLDALHAMDFAVAVETNGTCSAPPGLDWITVSPKKGGRLIVQHGSELKFAFPQTDLDPRVFETLKFEHFFLQPIDGRDRDANIAAAVQFCLQNPRWRLGVQTHKLVGLR